MRAVILSGALALGLIVPSAAQTAGPPAGNAASSTAPPGQPRRQPTPTTPTRLDNDKALQDANARQKRWDERMRRTTRSMCVGC